MSSRQTRRTVSIRGATYAALRIYADSRDESMSDVVEQLLSIVIGPDAVTVTDVGYQVLTRMKVEDPAIAETRRAIAEKIAARRRMPDPTPPDERERVGGVKLW